MKKILYIEFNKLFSSKLTYSFYLAVIILPIALYFGMFHFNTEDNNMDDFYLQLSTDISFEANLQNDEDIRALYVQQSNIALRLYNASLADDTEQVLKYEIELENFFLNNPQSYDISGYYGRYYGVNQNESIYDRIAYREHLIANDLSLVSMTNSAFTGNYFINNLSYLILIIVLIPICMLNVAVTLGDEYTEQTIQITLGNSISRIHLWIAKNIIVYFNTLLMFLLFCISISVVFALVDDYNSLAYPYKIHSSIPNSFTIGSNLYAPISSIVIQIFLFSFVNLFIFSSILMLICIIIQSQKSALVVGLGLCLFFFVSTSTLALPDIIQLVNTPLAIISGRGASTYQMLIFGNLVIFIVVLLCKALESYVFVRQDIK